jgi:Spy/CpxP family protein refolding chaperone
MRTAFSLRENVRRRGLPYRNAWNGGAIVRGLMILAAITLCLHKSPSQSKPVLPPDREDLLKGAGMGLASIADMKNYPGPRHVLDLTNELGLTRDQVKKTEALEKVVSSSAVAKGGEIVQAEEELGQIFEAGTVSEKVLRSKLEQISKLRADLRFIHLQAHLRMRQILTSEQIKLYAELKTRENQLQK